MTALQHLNSLADQRKAEQHPTFPYPVKSKYTDKDANSLTKCIVDYLNLSGHFATRLQSTGTYRADVGKFIPSQQRAGMPDVSAIVHGRAVYVEVKAGKDHLSAVQKETIAALISAGASVFIARDFAGFYAWFNALLPILTEAEVLPFGPPGKV